MGDSQLLLNSLGQVRIINDRIERYFRRELFIKVGGIDSGSLHGKSASRRPRSQHPGSNEV